MVKLPLKQRAKLAIKNNIGLIVLIVLFVLFATASEMDYQDEIAKCQNNCESTIYSQGE